MSTELKYLDGPALSPTRRGRSGIPIPLIYAPDKNYNEPSAHQMRILDRLHEVLDKNPVPTAFWAILMPSDIEILEKKIVE